MCPGSAASAQFKLLSNEIKLCASDMKMSSVEFQILLSCFVFFLLFIHLTALSSLPQSRVETLKSDSHSYSYQNQTHPVPLEAADKKRKLDLKKKNVI